MILKNYITFGGKNAYSILGKEIKNLFQKKSCIEFAKILQNFFQLTEIINKFKKCFKRIFQDGEIEALITDFMVIGDLKNVSRKNC